MTRDQHQATLRLVISETEWLKAYFWDYDRSTNSWKHVVLPAMMVTLRDAVALTRADLLKFGSVK